MVPPALRENKTMKRKVLRPVEVAAACCIAVGHLAGEFANAASDQSNVERILSVAREACFEHGASRARLGAFAAQAGWKTAHPTEIDRHHTDWTVLVGAWTFLDGEHATAVFQSVFRAPRVGAVCSITTKLASDEEHLELKDGFSRQFGTDISEEDEQSSLHIDRYWIDRGRSPPVKSSLSYDRMARTITIRMIHGLALPAQL